MPRVETTFIKRLSDTSIADQIIQFDQEFNEEGKYVNQSAVEVFGIRFMYAALSS